MEEHDRDLRREDMGKNQLGTMHTITLLVAKLNRRLYLSIRESHHVYSCYLDDLCTNGPEYTGFVLTLG